MTPIDIGDLSLSNNKGTLQEQLFHAIRGKIVAGLWPLGGKLPSTRKLASELSLSRNTVIGAYEQLVTEGYLESRQGSGFYVSVELPEHYLSSSNLTLEDRFDSDPVETSAFHLNKSFAPGVPDLAQFPMEKWQRMLLRHMGRTSLLGNQNVQGSMALRSALAGYLASSRSVSCSPQRIIITSGAQQALFIALNAILTRDDTVLMEQPGYAQMSKIINLQGFKFAPLTVREKFGIDLQQAMNSNAKAMYITPSNQYPMGTTLTTEQRLNLIEWAAENKRWIIEDDYDSEFQFAHRPYTSLQGLANEIGFDQQVIYVGSFSKVMFNGLRLGYLVVPETLLESCLAIKDATSGDSPTHTQEALTDFIREGDLLRHIRKMRRLYKQKHQRMTEAICEHFADRVEVISQPAGLHITLKWQGRVDEDQWVEKALQSGIVMRAMNYYENNPETYESQNQRGWGSVVLGFGNVELEKIEPNICKIAEIFDSLMSQ
ncbi:MocR-like pyridoxine biosynthesis transcription factor PdxR [Vibrio atypicus]|uniref:MocR-like pyridoxine biosynthesis transcription factor PdxR n=1 Tax=Vibrio atypicus TaxID=558271 RepID=UPI00135A079D